MRKLSRLGRNVKRHRRLEGQGSQIVAHGRRARYETKRSWWCTEETRSVCRQGGGAKTAGRQRRRRDETLEEMAEDGRSRRGSTYGACFHCFVGRAEGEPLLVWIVEGGKSAFEMYTF